MWLNGGPGASSMLGLLNGNGPCYVHSDSNSTYLNEWSWNNEVNMLYLDQPVQVGFSYDTLQNVTKDLAEGSVTPLDLNDDIPQQNATFLVGTYPSRNKNNTAQGVRNAAKAAWHFMQTFTQEFPAYQPNNSRISVTTESFVSQSDITFWSRIVLMLCHRVVAGDQNLQHILSNRIKRSTMGQSMDATAWTTRASSTWTHC